MCSRLARRSMLRGALTAGAWIVGRHAAGRSPNDKLNIAYIGVGGRGVANIESIEGENVVALCDVDDRRAGNVFQRFPQARKYHDFRRMLDEMDRQIDAVVVSTPDHTHAVAAMAAMHRGKHCYCEKPLSHSVYEARAMAELATRRKLATQLGIQRHVWPNFRRVVQLIRQGTIGPVSQCHIWIGGSRGGGERPTESPAVPAHLKWDLWLGPAPQRSYHPAYAPYGWRFWWDFGTGETGNMGCHILDLAFSALDLKYPTSIEAQGPPVHPETTPKAMSVRYEFSARGQQPPLVLTWVHGKAPVHLVPQSLLAGLPWGLVFVGTRGMLLTGLYWYRLLPEQEFADLQPTRSPHPKANGYGPEVDSRPHYQQWIAACKTGSSTSCHFGYAAPLTETVLLGNVAYRTGQRLLWDAERMRATNCPSAENFLRRQYREGWTLEGG